MWQDEHCPSRPCAAARTNKGAVAGHKEAVFLTGMPKHGGGLRSIETSLAKIKLFLRSRRFCPTTYAAARPHDRPYTVPCQRRTSARAAVHAGTHRSQRCRAAKWAWIDELIRTSSVLIACIHKLIRTNKGAVAGHKEAVFLTGMPKHGGSLRSIETSSG